MPLCIQSNQFLTGTKSLQRDNKCSTPAPSHVTARTTTRISFVPLTDRVSQKDSGPDLDLDLDLPLDQYKEQEQDQHQTRSKPDQTWTISSNSTKTWTRARPDLTRTKTGPDTISRTKKSCRTTTP